jgi:DNA ligase-1
MSFSTPMLAHKFYDSQFKFGPGKHEASGKQIVFAGDSGKYFRGKWEFSKDKTIYATDPTGWYMSEKMDGVRAEWVPKRNTLVGRGGKITYSSPPWFKDLMPEKCVLDGELFMGINTFQEISGVSRRKSVGNDWKRVTFEVFDIPNPGLLDKPFHHRMEVLEHVVKNMCKRWHTIRMKYGEANTPVSCPVKVIPQIKIKNMKHAYETFKKVIKRGGEGLVLRSPDSKYIGRRSWDMLKWKTTPTAEGKIVGYNEGKGKFKGILGTFKVRTLTNLKTFNLSGRIDKNFRSQYKFDNGKVLNPPKKGSVFPVVGDVVTFEYMAYTTAGIPRQPTYLHKRNKE